MDHFCCIAKAFVGDEESLKGVYIIRELVENIFIDSYHILKAIESEEGFPEHESQFGIGISFLNEILQVRNGHFVSARIKTHEGIIANRLIALPAWPNIE